MNNLQKKALLHALKGLLLPTISVCLIVFIGTLNVQTVFNILLNIDFWWLRILLVIIEIILFVYLYEMKLIKLQQEKEREQKQEFEQLIESSFQLVSEKEMLVNYHDLFSELELNKKGYMSPKNTSYIGGKVYFNDDYVLIKMNQERRITKI